MTGTKETNVSSVSLSDLEKLVGKIKEHTETSDVEISFEFIIASLFPTSWQNIQSALNYQYTQGYIQGHKDAEEERLALYYFRGEDNCYCE